jgi:hypothetical protein
VSHNIRLLQTRTFIAAENGHRIATLER